MLLSLSYLCNHKIIYITLYSYLQHLALEVVACLLSQKLFCAVAVDVLAFWLI